jgi:hypothetical protein
VKELLSHFQVTPKSVFAYVALFVAYVQSLGHFPQTPRQWGVTIGGFVLSTLVPAREPNANEKPVVGQFESERK